ncbi:hypothetical protein RI367_003334 [Sorochytrium milnesiophthora]
MYRKVLLRAVDTVCDGELHLLSEDEQQLCQRLTSASDNAQFLFARLALRKPVWLRLGQLQYEEVADVDKAVEELAAAGLATTQVHLQHMAEQVEVLTVDEMKALAKDCNILVRDASRSALHQAIVQFISAQTGIVGRGAQPLLLSNGTLNVASEECRDTILALVRGVIGSVVRLPDTVVALLQRLNLVYFRHLSHNETTLTTSILSYIGRRNFPAYECTRSPLVFPTRAELLAYEESLQLAQEMEEVMTVARNPGRAKEIFEVVYPKWRAVVASDAAEHITGLYWFQRFTPGWSYTKILEFGIDLLKSEKQYAEVSELLQLMLAQHFFRRGSRGDWYNNLALIQQRYLEPRQAQLKAARQTCMDALHDKYCHTAQLLAIQRRLQRIEVQLRMPRREQHNFDHLGLRRANQVVIHGKKLETDGVKSLWEPRPTAPSGDDASAPETVNVEHYALQWYAEQGWQGFHSENSILGTLFGLLFWDILFYMNPGGVFETEFQTQPLDLQTDAFYLAREERIRKRLNEIAAGRHLEILRRVDSRERERRSLCTGVRWDYAPDVLESVAQGLGGPALAAVCRVMAEDHRHTSSGMPDLCLWRRLDPQNTAVLFSEVKGPGDKLSEKQELWIDVLLRAGVDVDVCLVRDVADQENEKPAKRSPSLAERSRKSATAAKRVKSLS